MDDQHFSAYDNRELSWLKFNKRVLEQAEDNSTPLAERLFFLSVFSSNLDEFYTVRVGALMRRALTDNSERDSKTGLSPTRQLEKIYEKTDSLILQKKTCLLSV